MTRGPKRRIATKLEEVFGVPFAELIGKNFKKGASRYEVQKRLMEMIVERGLTTKATKVFPDSENCWDPSKWSHDASGAVSKNSNPAFRPSTLYHAIKDVKDDAAINSFDFCTSNKGRKADAERRGPTFNVELKCRICSTRHKNNGVTKVSDLNLRVYACPKCGSFGKCVAKVNEGGKTHYRAVVKINGIRQEVEVMSEDNLTPVVKEKTPGYKDQKESFMEPQRQKT